MKAALIISVLVIMFLGYSATDSFIVQPAARPPYCDDCIIPLETEQAQQTTILETVIAGIFGAGYRIKEKLK